MWRVRRTASPEHPRRRDFFREPIIFQERAAAGAGLTKPNHHRPPAMATSTRTRATDIGSPARDSVDEIRRRGRRVIEREVFKTPAPGVAMSMSSRRFDPRFCRAC